MNRKVASMTKTTLFAFLISLAIAIPPSLGQSPAIGVAKVGGKVAPDGKTELQIDLPDDQQKRNIGSPPPNGPGCCVFRSIDHASRWANVAALYGMPEWMAGHKPVIPGGGDPPKVSQLVAKIAAERGLPTPDILQVQNDDLEILKAALKSGRMVSITYNYSPTPGRYKGRIAHMVNLVHGDDAWFCVLDNNYIGEANLQWMDPATLKGVYTGGRGGKGWAVILLAAGPPPPPRNLSLRSPP